MRKLFTVVSAVCVIAVLCGVFTPTVQALAPGQVGSWTTSPNALPDTLTSPGYVTYNGYAYVLGGFNNDPWSDAVYYSKLNADGTNDAWVTNDNALPHVVGAPSAVAYNGRMYVMGGYGGGFQDVVYYATINNDGSLGTWTTSPNALPVPIYQSSAVAVNDRLYMFGGTTQAVDPATDAIFTAPINGDGSVGTWTTSSSTLPAELSRAASAYHDGWIYLAGGGTNSADRSTGVYYAKLNSDGSIDSWNTSPNSFPVSISGAGGISVGGYFYVIGGDIIDSFTNTDTIYYAAFNDDGSIGEWVLNDTTLPAPRQGVAVFAANSYLYVAGGHDGAAANSVFSAFAEPAAAPNPDPDQGAETTGALADTGTNHSTLVFLAGLLTIIGFGSLFRLLRSQRT